MDPLLDDMKAVRLRLNLSNIFLQGKLKIIIYPRTNFKIVILSSYDSSLYKNLALNRELVKKCPRILSMWITFGHNWNKQ